ncbi:hypothetical protein C0991_010323 [Blastosporella zonata]|nr:hypothetical protein C0991_010323 [Blastosporella zonata]
MELYDFYTNGFEEGEYKHRAHVYVPEIQSTSATGTTTSQQFSAPSLSDLLNEDNISPLDVNVDRLEAEWFEAADPYDLNETDRADAANPDQVSIVRCSTRWKMAELVKLDSPSLTTLISRLGGNNTVSIIGAKGEVPKSASAVQTGEPDDWNIDNFV